LKRDDEGRELRCLPHPTPEEIDKLGRREGIYEWELRMMSEHPEFKEESDSRRAELSRPEAEKEERRTKK
jgi:hypothetical protein